MKITRNYSATPDFRFAMVILLDFFSSAEGSLLLLARLLGMHIAELSAVKFSVERPVDHRFGDLPRPGDMAKK